MQRAFNAVQRKPRRLGFAYWDDLECFNDLSSVAILLSNDPEYKRDGLFEYGLVEDDDVSFLQPAQFAPYLAPIAAHIRATCERINNKETNHPTTQCIPAKLGCTLLRIMTPNKEGWLSAGVYVDASVYTEKDALGNQRPAALWRVEGLAGGAASMNLETMPRLIQTNSEDNDIKMRFNFNPHQRFQATEIINGSFCRFVESHPDTAVKFKFDVTTFDEAATQCGKTLDFYLTNVKYQENWLLVAQSTLKQLQAKKINSDNCRLAVVNSTNTAFIENIDMYKTQGLREGAFLRNVRNFKHEFVAIEPSNGSQLGLFFRCDELSAWQYNVSLDSNTRMETSNVLYRRLRPEGKKDTTVVQFYEPIMQQFLPQVSRQESPEAVRHVNAVWNNFKSCFLAGTKVISPTF